MPFIDNLATSCAGAGPPALLVHGFGGSKYTWRFLQHRLANLYTTIAVDLPGSGDSNTPINFSYSLQGFANVLIELVTHKDLQNLTLITHSLGAGIAFITLIKGNDTFRRRIKAICIIDGICYPQDLPFFVSLLRIPVLGAAISDLAPVRMQAEAVLRYCYFDKSRITEEQIQTYANYLQRRGVREALRRTARVINQAELSAYIPSLAHIGAPCQLIWGKYDSVVPLSLGERLAKSLPHARLDIIDDCGHMPQEECPQEVENILRRFAAELDDRQKKC